MVTTLPAPVFFVAADALKDFEGVDALCTLWTLFSKCKDSLCEGRRLENMSWRLWHREMRPSHLYRPPTPESLSSALSDSSSSYCDPHESARLPSPALLPIAYHSPAPSSSSLGSTMMISHGSRIHEENSCRRSASKRPSRSFGRLIFDILPRRLVPHVDADCGASAQIQQPHSQRQQPPIPHKFSPYTNAHSSSASPAAATSSTSPSRLVDTIPSVPTVHLPSTPPSTTTFPRVIVVNPTPHPTPPATPTLPNGVEQTSQLLQQPPPLLVSASEHLLPPALSPVLVALPSPPSHHKQQRPQQPQPQPQVIASSSKIAPAQPQALISPPPPPPPPHPPQAFKRPADETLKPSDRRFFLQSPKEQFAQRKDAAGSMDSSRTPSTVVTERSSTSGSGSSSQRPGSVDSGGVGGPPPGAPVCGRLRKGKETMRQHATSGAQRAAATRVGGAAAHPHPHVLAGAAGRHHHYHHVAAMHTHHRKSSDQKARPAFKIGSTSSTGSRSTGSGRTNSAGGDAGSKMAPASATACNADLKKNNEASVGPLSWNGAGGGHARVGSGVTAAAAAATAARNLSHPELLTAAVAPQRRRIVVASTSSEYETTTTDSEEEEWDTEGGEEEDDPDVGGEDGRLREAAVEAQRQRELFAKVPRRSYSNITRTHSVGLLSALLNPDPNIFPPNHPYRTSYSSHDLQRLRQYGSGPVPVRLQTGRSSSGLPLAAQTTNITAQAPLTNGQGDGGAGASGSATYRRKGQPHEQEMEDYSDSGDENAHDQIQVSSSVAQQRLAALVGRRSSDRGPTTTTTTTMAPLQRPVLQTVATAPIPFTHPYNLPAPEPPTTPRTTRRQMLSTELSESLRRNLLWARQVGKTSMMGGVRRPSAGGVLGAGLRPLTTLSDGREVNVNGLQRSHAAMPPPPPPPLPPPPPPPPLLQQHQHQPQPRSSEGDPQAARKRAAMARNRSWAGDYHYSGW